MTPSSFLALSPAPRRANARACSGWMLCATLLVPLAPHAAAAATPESSKTAHHHHRHAAAKATAAGTAHHKRHHPAASSGVATAHHHGHAAAAHAPAHAGPASRHHAAIAPHATHARHAAVVAAPVAAGVGAAAASTGGAAVAIPPSATPAEPPAPADKGAITGLPLPRFAALRADEVNMRSGPGQRYPIEWVYHRRDLPVKIEREFDVWRLVEDSDGQKGWVHQATLVGTRSFVIPGLPPVDPAQATPPAPSAGAPATPPAAQQATNPPSGHFDSREVGRLADPGAAASIPGAVMLRSAPDAGSALVAVLKPARSASFVPARPAPVGAASAYNIIRAGWTAMRSGACCRRRPFNRPENRADRRRPHPPGQNGAN